jgi:hypothetical protein
MVSGLSEDNTQLKTAFPSGSVPQGFTNPFVLMSVMRTEACANKGNNIAQKAKIIHL